MRRYLVIAALLAVAAAVEQLALLAEWALRQWRARPPARLDFNRWQSTIGPWARDAWLPVVLAALVGAVREGCAATRAALPMDVDKRE